jgi:hypothetical protein
MIYFPGLCSRIVTNANSVSEPNFFSIGSVTDDYNAGMQFIDNGGTDLYNEGNYIQVPALSDNYVTYLENCGEGSVNGEQYYMAMNGAGISVTLFKNYEQESIAIGGELGADGEGQAVQGSFEYSGWKGFWKTVNECHPMTGADCDGYDPTLHHLWVTDAPITSTNHDIATDTDNDRDILTMVNGYNVVYFMWATQAGTISSDLVMQELVTSVVNALGK